jgi:D-alanine-D-alanine ligase
MSKKTIALLAGGYSGESVISMRSAAVAEKYLDREKYNVYKIVISRAGWHYQDEVGKVYDVDKNDFTLKIGRKRVKFDAVLMIIHGTPGEDGKLQGYFDMLQIPYTSCDAATSALTFNKRYTVGIGAFAGIPVSQSVHLFRHEPYSVKAVLDGLSLPVFVKPNNGGSSIGMSKVNRAEDLGPAIEKAFNEDDQVLVEQFIKGREFTIGVFRTRGEIIALPMTEVISKKDFFDYEAKYTTGMANEVTPADLEEVKADVIRQTAVKAYHVFNCSGIVRIDFIWNEADNKPYMLEINTVPGQSENSIVPQQVRALGWTMTEFYDRQIEEALNYGL